MVSVSIGWFGLWIRIAIAVLAILFLIDLASAELFEEWNRSFGEADAFSITSDISQTSDGGYIVVGQIQNRSSAIGPMGWFFKIDAKGNMQWNRTFGGKYCDTICSNGIQSALQTSDGGYILAGAISHQRETYDQDIWLIKTDAIGNEQWNRTFGDNNSEFASHVKETGDGYLIMGGKDEDGIAKVLLIKTDKNGNEVWKRVFEGQYHSFPISIEQTPDEGFALFAGHWNGDWTGNRAWVIKIDPKGNMRWNRIIEENDKSWVTASHKVKDGYIIAGNTEDPNIWLMKADEKGDVQWKRTIGVMGGSTSVQMTEDGGYLIAGYLIEVNLSTGYYQNNYLRLIKTDGIGNVIWDRTFGRGKTVKVGKTSDGGYIITGYRNLKNDNDPLIYGYSRTVKVGEKEILTSYTPQSNNTKTYSSGSEEKLDGFEAVLSITIILALYIAGMIRR